MIPRDRFPPSPLGSLLGALGLLGLLAAPNDALAGPLDPSPLQLRVVGDACRVRADRPVTCSSVTSIAMVRGETASFQVLLESNAPLARAALVVDGDDPLVVRARREIFLPVETRTRGRAPDGDALAWSASARPDDDEALGLVADPLVADLSPEALAPGPGRRTAAWIDVTAASGAPAGTYAIRARVGWLTQVVKVELIDAELPPIPISSFAYVEDAELASMPDPEEARFVLRRMLLEAHVSPVGTTLDVPDLQRDLSSRGDLTVLGAYGVLGPPDAASIAQVERMADALMTNPDAIVLYAADEDCASPLPAAWRTAIRASERRAMERVRVLATCDRPSSDVDIAMVPAASFSDDLARSMGRTVTDVWVYNGRLPHAGPMALDAPPESLIWNGWIAARYDVGRWFYWNTNHWTDRNRGGRGPRDLFTDTETFHNADGDVVLEDGVLVYPAHQIDRFTQIGGPDPVLGSIRLAHLRRGAEDAALLALAFQADPEVARAGLVRIIPRALGDVPPVAPTPFGRAEELRVVRASLHAAIARAHALHLAEGRVDSRMTADEAHAGLAKLRASTPQVDPPSSGPALLLGGAVMALGAALAVLLARNAPRGSLRSGKAVFRAP